MQNETPSLIHREGMDRYIGAFAVDLPAVQRVPTPKATGAHYPIGHGEVYEAVAAYLRDAGIGAREMFHALYQGGDRYIGLAVTDLPGGGGGRETVVGWFNSHDKSQAVTLLFGERVFVCFNLVFGAEVKIARKHTRYIERDLPELVSDGFTFLEDHRREQTRRVEAYLDTPLAEPAAHHLAIRLLDEEVFPVTHLPAILAEWRHPSVPELRERSNVDRLYQAVTRHPQPLRTMARRHARLHAVLDAHCGIAGEWPMAPSRAETVYLG